MQWMQERSSVSQLEIQAKTANLIGSCALLIMLSVAVLFSGCIDAPGDGVKVITVGAANFQGHVADFSGSGPLRDGRIKPDVLAPGEDVISTVPLGLGEVNYIGTFYARESGTSLSTPVAAGVAALA
jgi:subtilisin family serine protease